MSEMETDWLIKELRNRLDVETYLVYKKEFDYLYRDIEVLQMDLEHKELKV